MAEKADEEKVKESWRDTFPSDCKVTVKLDGKKIIEKLGGKRVK